MEELTGKDDGATGQSIEAPTPEKQDTNATTLRMEEGKNSTTSQPNATIAPPEDLVEGDVVLHRWRSSDANGLHAAASRSIAELSQWMPWAVEGYSHLKAEQFIDFARKSWESGEEYHFAIVLDGQASGSFGLMKPLTKKPNTLELGYWLATDATGRGLAGRAASLLTRTAFEIGAEHVQIRHQELNKRSAAIPQRLGFTNMGMHTLDEKGDGEGTECVVWQMDRTASQRPL
ncbi:hypothetical protein QQS21_009961 [Conoideocrella luteorostrata]|uniref:N-acetyltransferase domain-containing protein n=1 Tax=Conoideocrella luteorostrata TaxID=1105319 RepID=A0AAJ0CIM3_9HYPO|nr:hypothetical protein QQS21_009961 [Conoideocrella luteorostrata]